MRKVALLGLLALSGCVTAEQRMAQDNDQCLSYGVAKGSPAYVECRMRLDSNRAQVKASERFASGGGGIIGAIRRSSE
jgi:hypothetical protein